MHTWCAYSIITHVALAAVAIAPTRVILLSTSCAPNVLGRIVQAIGAATHSIWCKLLLCTSHLRCMSLACKDENRHQSFIDSHRGIAFRKLHRCPLPRRASRCSTRPHRRKHHPHRRTLHMTHRSAHVDIGLAVVSSSALRQFDSYSQRAKQASQRR